MVAAAALAISAAGTLFNGASQPPAPECLDDAAMKNVLTAAGLPRDIGAVEIVVKADGEEISFRLCP